MKICITSKGTGMDSLIDPRFGRCAYFVFVDTEKTGFEIVSNLHAAESGGAGIKSGQLICEKGADVVITGNVGPNAYDTLNAAEIKIITGISGSVKEVIEKYKKGELKATNNPTVKSHFGMNDKK